MKTLTLSALLCAMMALTRAAALPDAKDEAGTGHVVKRSTCCPDGWTAINSHCFRYVPQPLTWAVAERKCMSMGGHLASVQNIQDYKEIQAMILTVSHNQGVTWIGGSDAEREEFWFWSDGSPFSFTKWCNEQPDNNQGRQNCLTMNYSDQKCWDDSACDIQLPSVCQKHKR